MCYFLNSSASVKSCVRSLNSRSVPIQQIIFHSLRKKKMSEDGYIKTAAQNYISREAHIYGPRNVEMKGKSIILPSAYIRGDFAAVRIGRYCKIGKGSVLRPCYNLDADTENKPPSNNNNNNKTSKATKFTPLFVGNYTQVGSDCVIEASSIGSNVHVGNDVVVGKRCVIKDNCWIESGCVLTDGMVVPPFSIVRGCPGRISVRSLPESSAVEFTDRSIAAFEDFVEEETRAQNQ